MSYEDYPPEKQIAFWKMQATSAFDENDRLSAGIKRIYELLGHKKKFVVAHNQALNQLDAIIAKLEKK